MDILILLLALFVLSLFLGVELIPHYPTCILNVGTNAVSGITLVGALLAAGNGGSPMLVNAGVYRRYSGNYQCGRRISCN